MSPGEKQWHLSATWVLDTEQYNEWMSEEDYEVDENGKKLLHRLRLGVDDLTVPGSDDRAKKKTNEKKRKRSPSPQVKSGSKRKIGRSPAAFQKNRRGDDDDSEDLTRDMEDPAPEPNITEVKPGSSSSFSGPGTPNARKDPESQPIKVG